MADLQELLRIRAEIAGALQQVEEVIEAFRSRG